jgi:hypothetical protein
MRRRLLITCVLAVLLSACAAAQASAELRWATAFNLTGAIDFAGPRGDGSLVVAAADRLSILGPDRKLRPFARGKQGYRAEASSEAYIARSTGGTVPDAGCSFKRGDVFGLVTGKPGVQRVDRRGRASRFADLPAKTLPAAIAFDGVGTFGHRLLAVQTTATTSRVVAIDCKGRVKTLTKRAPHLEGGMVVAPASFGNFAGQLIAPDELGGKIVAIDSSGQSRLVADTAALTGAGGDIGVESLGFAPAALRPDDIAYVSDRGAQVGGVDRVLRLSGRSLAGAGVQGGDLIGVSEKGGPTVAVRCGDRCTVRRIAHGPSRAHIEGHVVFGPAAP